MVYPYAFYRTSDGMVYIESENCSMRYFKQNKDVEYEYYRFLSDFPDLAYQAKKEFSDWRSLSNGKRQTLKSKYFKEYPDMDFTGISTSASNAHTHTINSDLIQSNGSIMFGNCQAATTYLQAQPTTWYEDRKVTIKEEGKTPMCYAKNVTKIEEVNEFTILQDQRRELLNALHGARGEKLEFFHAHFHMEPVGPRTVGEALEWVKAGKFKPLKDEALKSRYIYDMAHYLVWEDKENPPQTEAYNKARDAMDKAFTAAERTIKIKSAEAGLEALVAFEEATFH